MLLTQNMRKRAARKSFWQACEGSMWISRSWPARSWMHRTWEKLTWLWSKSAKFSIPVKGVLEKLFLTFFPISRTRNSWSQPNGLLHWAPKHTRSICSCTFTCSAKKTRKQENISVFCLSVSPGIPVSWSPWDNFFFLWRKYNCV